MAETPLLQTKPKVKPNTAKTGAKNDPGVSSAAKSDKETERGSGREAPREVKRANIAKPPRSGGFGFQTGGGGGGGIIQPTPFQRSSTPGNDERAAESERRRKQREQNPPQRKPQQQGPTRQPRQRPQGLARFAPLKRFKGKKSLAPTRPLNFTRPVTKL